MTQEPGSVHLSTLKESTQAWLTDRKIKGFYTGLTSCKSWFVCFFSMSFYLSCFCVQWLRATALRREPSPAWPWPGWASSPPTWCWLASRQTGWATCWRQSSTSLSFKEHLISILLWGFLGKVSMMTPSPLYNTSAVYVTHQCLSRVRNGLDFSEHFKAEETLQGDAEGAVSCFPPWKGQIYFLLDWGKYIISTYHDRGKYISSTAPLM